MNLQSNAYTEGIYTGILEVIQLQYPPASWKTEYSNVLTKLGKSPEDVKYWVNYFFTPRNNSI